MSVLDTLKENKNKLLVRVGVILAGVAGLAVLLPVIYSAFLASLGLLGVGITAIIGFGIFSALPMLGQKWENAMLGIRKAEARANPIEQMQNDLMKRKEEIKTTEAALGRIGGIVKSMESMLDDQAKKDPEHDLTTARKSLEAMKNFYSTNIGKLKLAIQKGREFEKEIERKKFEFTFAEAGKTFMNGMSGSEGDAMQKLLSDEAFKAVSDQFNAVFADLEVRSVLDQAEAIESRHETFEEMLKAREASEATKVRDLG